jgi:hypothetical protein
MATKRMPYEPSTSGWSVINHRRRITRRRVMQWSVGGSLVLLAGAIAGLFLLIGPASARGLGQ